MAVEAGTQAHHAELGDRRGARRLAALVQTLAAAPMATVSEACRGSRAAIKAAYRFWATEAITPDAIRASHIRETVQRSREHALILAVQDTTELNFTTHRATTGLGHLSGPDQYGILVHSTLAITPDGVPIGLLAQESWTRDPMQKGINQKRRTRPITEKESSRWLRAQAATLAVVPPGVGVLTIADQEGDIYALFAAPRRPEAHFLIRATDNRRLVEGEDGERAYLWSTVAASPETTTLVVHLERTPTRPEREACLVIRARHLTLRPPKGRAGSGRMAPVPVMAILAEEVDPPPGQKAIRWQLLTTFLVETLADACAMVQAYTFRWLVERYHFVLKSGCHVEHLQLRTADRLQRALATYCVLAWEVLWFTYQARATPQAAGFPVLEPAEQAVLQAAVPSLGAAPTLHQVVRAIATLGGFQGRTHDGEPGVKVLWRGLTALQLMARGWQLHDRSQPRSVP